MDSVNRSEVIVEQEIGTGREMLSRRLVLVTNARTKRFMCSPIPLTPPNRI